MSPFQSQVIYLVSFSFWIGTITRRTLVPKRATGMISFPNLAFRFINLWKFSKFWFWGMISTVAPGNPEAGSRVIFIGSNETINSFQIKWLKTFHFLFEKNLSVQLSLTFVSSQDNLISEQSPKNYKKISLISLSAFVLFFYTP